MQAKVIIFVICTYFAVSYAQTCATTDCGPYPCCQDELRGPSCYQSNLYTCASGVLLCPLGYGACNGGCFDPSVYYCSNNVLYQLGSNGAPPTACGPIASGCGAGIQCCNDSLTGEQCVYQPNLYTCYQNIRLCPKGDGVCGTACYDASLYVCVNGVITQIGATTGATATQGPTARPTLAATTNAPTNSPATTSAPVTPTACGPIVSGCGAGVVCCNDSINGQQCVYQPNLYTCFQNIRLCPKGDGVCGTDCYDASNYICVNGVITQIPSSTTGGSSATTQAPTVRATSAPTPTASSVPTCANTDCGGFACCPDEVLGPVCIYQPTLYTCASGIRLCGAGQGVCGTACYNAAMYYCDNGVITLL